MKDLTHICTACPDYPRCNFNRERSTHIYMSKTNENTKVHPEKKHSFQCFFTSFQVYRYS